MYECDYFYIMLLKRKAIIKPYDYTWVAYNADDEIVGVICKGSMIWSFLRQYSIRR